MKVLMTFILLSVTIMSCGPASSPQGRMTIKLTELKQQLDSLKSQNIEIKDSLGKMRAELKLLENKN